MFVALAETIFINRLTPALAYFAPGVSPALVNELGATGIRLHFKGALLKQVILAYNRALDQSFVSWISNLWTV